MGSARALVAARLLREEATRLLPYDDATGKPVHAPAGKITWGIGFNLEACGSPGLFAVMLDYLLAQIETAIQDYTWYIRADETRRSVFLDIAYNDGVAGLLDFYRLLMAATREDWNAAATECHVKNPQLAGRYAALAELLRVGDTP